MSFLGEAIKLHRERRSMSLQDVADEAGISKNHVWELEQGRTKNPTAEVMLGLAVALDMNPCDVALCAIADIPPRNHT